MSTDIDPAKRNEPLFSTLDALAGFIIRHSKICAIEPMQPPGDFEVVATEAERAQERYKVHLDGGQELIVNRAMAEHLIGIVDDMNDIELTRRDAERFPPGARGEGEE